MNPTHARLASWSLILGSALATAGYLSAFAANGNGDERFAGSSWSALYTFALLGDVLVILGLPAVFAAQRGRCPRLTTVGYVGLFVPLVVLNVGEGTIEGFTKPYLAQHGGLPATDLPGLAAFEAPALVGLLVGVVCLGIAVLRGGVLPRWIGVVLLVSPFLGVAGLPGVLALLSDLACFVALSAIGVHVLRSVSVPEDRASTRPLPTDVTAA